jgi:DNA-binding CsgD family transcriptional regulator
MYVSAKGNQPDMRGSYARSDRLVERDAELTGLRGALRRASDGGGTVTFVESTPGTGRSRLLAAAAAAAEADMLVLRASGRETERQFAFGVALQLFEDRWFQADAAELFAGPARWARRLVAGHPPEAADEPSGDTFDVIRGLFWTAKNMTEGGTRPLALIVDDVRRADAPSLGFLAYLGARVGDLPIALIVAARTGEPATDPDAVNALRAAATVVLQPGALSPDAAAGVAEAEIPDADPALWEACADASGGNPFLLHALLDEVRRLGPQVGPTATTVAECVPGPVVAWVRSQLAALPPAASALASAVAALAGPTALPRAASVAGLGPEEAARAADALAALGILRAGAPIVFANEIVERAVLQSVPQLERDALQHRAETDGGPLGHPQPPPSQAHQAVPAEARTTGLDETPPAPDERVMLAHLAIESGLRGEHRTRVTKLSELAWGDGATAEADPADPLIGAGVAQALLLVDELELGLEILADSGLSAPDMDGKAAATSAYCRAWMLYHRGEVLAAMTAAQNALDTEAVAADGAHHGLHAVLAACLIQRGELESADARLQVLDTPEGILDPDLALLFDVRAQLQLARNRAEDALADALEAGRRAEALSGTSPPGLVAWRSTAALAHLALDEPARARELVEEEHDRARSAGVTRVTLRALRVVGLASTGRTRLDVLEEAVAFGADAPVRLEYLHALVDLGAATRRANHRAAARQPLTKALELAREMGAAAVAHRAEEEITAGAGRRRRPRETGSEALTPSERRVALLAADGLTTRQIAGELYVTPKTVEFHLRHIYRKLGVPSNRAALAGLFDGGDSATPGSH